MAILGQIRQRSFFLIIVIGMALFAFVISGVLDGNSSRVPNDPIAVVNDEEVELTFFRQMVDLWGMVWQPTSTTTSIFFGIVILLCIFSVQFFGGQQAEQSKQVVHILYTD